eukprot:3456169-Rhodomonas_salina.17
MRSFGAQKCRLLPWSVLSDMKNENRKAVPQMMTMIVQCCAHPSDRTDAWAQDSRKCQTIRNENAQDDRAKRRRSAISVSDIA